MIEEVPAGYIKEIFPIFKLSSNHRIMIEEAGSQEYSINQDDFNKFVSTLKNEEKDEIDKIITRYRNYEPAMAEAALHVAVDKGMLRYDIKENLQKQIRYNFSKKASAAKQSNWEAANAFKGYVSSYTDDEIYSLIEDPADIVIDVYHAVLAVAKERELITAEESERSYKDALDTAGNDEDLFRDVLTFRRELYGSGNIPYEKKEDETDIIPPTSKFSPGRYLLSRFSLLMIVIGGVTIFTYFKENPESSGVSEAVPVIGLVALIIGLISGWFWIKSLKNKNLE